MDTPSTNPKLTFESGEVLLTTLKETKAISVNSVVFRAKVGSLETESAFVEKDTATD